VGGGGEQEEVQGLLSEGLNGRCSEGLILTVVNKDGNRRRFIDNDFRLRRNKGRGSVVCGVER
jgi:hypothetical protein